MSNGNSYDWDNTVAQIKNPDPVKNGKTWLRHRAGTEAEAIDLMVLKGTYTRNEMIDELNFRKEKPRHIWQLRISIHLAHLQDGIVGGTGQTPHNLKIVTENGRCRFDVEGCECKIKNPQPEDEYKI